MRGRFRGLVVGSPNIGSLRLLGLAELGSPIMLV
jgi:hypothetical protein